jgi:hypothetical protein
MPLPAAVNVIPMTVIKGMSCPGNADAFPACTREIAASLKPLSH